MAFPRLVEPAGLAPSTKSQKREKQNPFKFLPPAGMLQKPRSTAHSSHQPIETVQLARMSCCHKQTNGLEPGSETRVASNKPSRKRLPNRRCAITCWVVSPSSISTAYEVPNRAPLGLGGSFGTVRLLRLAEFNIGT